MIAEIDPDEQRVRPPYISRTISSRPRWPSAPRKNLPPAPNQTGPIGCPSGLTTSLLLAVDGDLLGRVGGVGPGVGHVRRPQRRGKHEDDDQDEQGDEGERDAVAAHPSPGQVPGAATLEACRLLGGERHRPVASPAERGVRVGLRGHQAAALRESHRRQPTAARVGPAIAFAGRSSRSEEEPNVCLLAAPVSIPRGLLELEAGEVRPRRSGSR